MQDRSRETEIEVFSLNGVVAKPWLVVGVRRDGLEELAVLVRVICLYGWPDHLVSLHRYRRVGISVCDWA